jgi:uncharacterized membrane protein YvbJ
MAYCPNCGEELKGKFNFCPSCGFDLQKIGEAKESSHSDSTDTEIIICDNCGTENPAGIKICEGCGIRLSGSEKITKKEPVKSVTEKKQSQPKHVKEKSPGKKDVSGQTVKEIDSKKILIIAAIVIVGGFIILLTAGVFDRPPSSNVSSNVTQGQGSGVDLNALQRINELEEKVKNNPKDKESLLELAHLRNDSGMYEKAIEDYEKYLKIVPNDADVRVDMGVCYYSLRKFDEAIKAMTEALKYKPNHQIAHLNLGIVNLAEGNLEKSKEWLKKAVAIDPNSDAGKRAQELLSSH